MLTIIIILWILWRLCRPWYGGWHRPPIWHYHHVPMGGWRRPPMGGFGGHRGGFGGAFGGGGHTMGGGAGRGRR